jgi:hypothetical protein
MSREEERRWCSSRGVPNSAPDELGAHDDAGRASSAATGAQTTTPARLGASPAGGAMTGAVSGAYGAVSGVSVGAQLCTLGTT